MTATLDTPTTATAAEPGPEETNKVQQPQRPVLELVPSTRREDVVATTNLTAEQIEELGRRLDGIRDRILAERGASDAAYIRDVIRKQRALEIGGRALLFAGVLPPAWIAGTAMLSIAKILENMEIGHNVMHGQWDWMRDPKIHSSAWEWDNVSSSAEWKHSHNYLHHTYTNVVGKDRDVGYGILRLSEEQRWNPYYLGNPVYNFLLSLFFEYGVALHDLEVEKVVAGEKPLSRVWQQVKSIGRKAGRQAFKDYLAFPALAGPFWASVLAGNVTANLVRNVWSHAVIFCGHFPTGAVQFEEEQLDDESRGEWYVRQLLGSANLDGSRFFHLMTGQLSFQIEHHLFPDLPSNRYAEIAPEVRELCEEYGLEYTTGPLWKQYLQVLGTINRLALPNGKR